MSYRHFRYLMTGRRERAVMWLANVLPRKLVYWCAIRVMAAATVGPYSDQVVPELRCCDALKRWERKA